MVPRLGPGSLNYQDNIYLDISRQFSLARGAMFLFSPLLAICTVVSISTLLPIAGEPYSYEFMFIGIFAFVVCFYAFLHSLKHSISPPRDLPIRFNRARQRIYAYNFKYRWWNPFERWQVVPVAYDWSQVRAERWKKRGMTAQGAIIIKWGVVLSIVKPGTNDVIDRFPLSTMGADEFAWAYICTYMQQGPGALPPSELSRDHNDVPWYNLALRLAPKVRWPIEMDHESRTTP